MDAAPATPTSAPATGAAAHVLRRKRLLRSLRLVVLVVAAVGFGYLYQRYELLGTSAQACSPVLGIEPGTKLLIDRRPVDEHLYLGDLVVYRLATGEVTYGRITSPPGAPVGTRRTDAGFWILGDNPDCPLPDSRSEGILPLDAIEARVLFPLRF